MHSLGGNRITSFQKDILHCFRTTFTIKRETDVQIALLMIPCSMVQDSTLPQNGVSAIPDELKIAFQEISCLPYLFHVGSLVQQLQNSFHIGVLKQTGISVRFSVLREPNLHASSSPNVFTQPPLSFSLWSLLIPLSFCLLPGSSFHPQPAAGPIAPCLTYLEQVVQVSYLHWKTFENGNLQQDLFLLT